MKKPFRVSALLILLLAASVSGCSSAPPLPRPAILLKQDRLVVQDLDLWIREPALKSISTQEWEDGLKGSAGGTTTQSSASTPASKPTGK